MLIKKRFYSLTVIVRLSNLNLLCSFFIIKCIFHQVKKKKRKKGHMLKQISRAGRFRMFHCLKSKPSFIHLVKVQTGNMESITAVKKREIDKKLNTTVSTI